MIWKSASEKQFHKECQGHIDPGRRSWWLLKDFIRWRETFATSPQSLLWKQNTRFRLEFNRNHGFHINSISLFISFPFLSYFLLVSFVFFLLLVLLVCWWGPQYWSSWKDWSWSLWILGSAHRECRYYDGNLYKELWSRRWIHCWNWRDDQLPQTSCS